LLRLLYSKGDARMRNCGKHLWCLAAVLALAICGCNLLEPSAEAPPETAVEPAKTPPVGDSTASAARPVEKKDAVTAAPDEIKRRSRVEVKDDAKVETKKVAYVPVDISAAFNTGATGGKKGFDGYGNAYPAAKLSALKPTSPPFDLPDFTKVEKNVLTATGQKLNVPPGKYSALHVLAAAANGDQESKVTLGYADKAAEVAFKISDWCRKPSFGELLAASFDRVSGEHEGARCKLYVQKIALDPTKDLHSITVPANERIHIFAMTLAR